MCTEVKGDACSGSILGANTEFEYQLEKGTSLKLNNGVTILECNEAYTGGFTTAESGEPLMASGLEAGMECPTSTEMLGQPWKAAFSRTTGGNGTVTLTSSTEAELGWRETIPYPPYYPCERRAPSIVLDFKGGAPAKLVAANEILKGKKCGELKVSGTFQFATPNPLFLGSL